MQELFTVERKVPPARTCVFLTHSVVCLLPLRTKPNPNPNPNPN